MFGAIQSIVMENYIQNNRGFAEETGSNIANIGAGLGKKKSTKKIKSNQISIGKRWKKRRFRMVH